MKVLEDDRPLSFRCWCVFVPDFDDVYELYFNRILAWNGYITGDFFLFSVCGGRRCFRL